MLYCYNFLTPVHGLVVVNSTLEKRNLSLVCWMIHWPQKFSTILFYFILVQTIIRTSQAIQWYIGRLNLTSTHTLAPSNTEENFGHFGNILNTNIPDMHNDSLSSGTNPFPRPFTSCTNCNYTGYAVQSDIVSQLLLYHLSNQPAWRQLPWWPWGCGNLRHNLTVHTRSSHTIIWALRARMLRWPRLVGSTEAGTKKTINQGDVFLTFIQNTRSKQEQTLFDLNQTKI